MKRIISPALVVLLLLVLLPKEQSRARDESPISLASLTWKQLSDGVAKTDMGTGLPEVAILKLSDDQFKKIYPSKGDTAKDYLNSQGIFKRKLIKVIFCDVEPSTNGQPWILIIPHTTLSTGSIVAWQVPKNGKDE